MIIKMDSTRTSNSPKLSIVVRCRNEERSLRRLLTILASQRCDFEWELIIVDNESEDRSRETAREFGAAVVSIGRKEFTYGAALNLGISQARGELVLLISAHVLPVGRYFLSAAVEPFSDPELAAARCLAVGKLSQVENWDRPEEVQYQSTREQTERESKIGYKYYTTASCAVIRRSIWEQVKFDELMVGGEDKFWASCVLAKGHKIRSWSEALCLYTRKATAKERLEKRGRDYAAIYRITGRNPLRPSQYLLRNIKAVLLAPVVAASYLKNHIVWNTILVTTAWRAKRKVKRGSLKEFDIPDYLRD